MAGAVTFGVVIVSTPIGSGFLTGIFSGHRSDNRGCSVELHTVIPCNVKSCQAADSMNVLLRPATSRYANAADSLSANPLNESAT